MIDCVLTVWLRLATTVNECAVKEEMREREREVLFLTERCCAKLTTFKFILHTTKILFCFYIFNAIFFV